MFVVRHGGPFITSQLQSLEVRPPFASARPKRAPDLAKDAGQSEAGMGEVKQLIAEMPLVRGSGRKAVAEEELF